jgi:hypothetical protein
LLLLLLRVQFSSGGQHATVVATPALWLTRIKSAFAHLRGARGFWTWLQHPVAGIQHAYVYEGLRVAADMLSSL